MKKLSTLIDVPVRDGFDPVINGLTQDSRKVREGYLFAAVPGHKDDGHRFITDAVRHGAVAVVALPGTALLPEVAERVVLVPHENPRRALAQIAARFYDSQPRVLAAVTGTNGKTSTVHFAQQIWRAMGLKAACLGTLGVVGSGKAQTGSLTTPDSVALHATLADLAASGITHLAMEASSHGLHQSRLDGVKASVAGFTSFSHDHLDYHGNMDDYLIAKAHLFSDILQHGGTAVLNADIPEYRDLTSRLEGRACRIISYGEKGSDIRLLHQKPTPSGQQVTIAVAGQEMTLSLPLVGRFQVMNALCALGLVIAEFANDPQKVVATVPYLEKLTGVPGRLQWVEGHPCGAVYVDYAHTPDALERVIEALRPHTAGKLVCLIGCGGNRDAAKRPVMGRIAAVEADLAIITDDNPRDEDPALIRRAMMQGAAEGNAIEIGDRRMAITQAVTMLEEGDVLVIAGKGHEQGQIIGERVEPFDDAAEARRAIAELRG